MVAMFNDERSGEMICFVGPLPRPRHGMSYVNLMMVERLEAVANVTVIDIASGLDSPGVVAKARRLLRFFAALPKIVLCRIRGAQVAYGSVDQGSGAWFTATWVALARLLGMRVFLHHHSFRYLLRATRPMQTLTRVAGPLTEHIVLCRRMEAQLRYHYRSVGSVSVVPNIVADLGPIPERSGDGVFTIGMLSNLTFEKGVGRFLSVLTSLVERGQNVRGVLAGPAMTADVTDSIDVAQRALGARLDYRGRVMGAQKDEFFASIDCFVFGTETEAYPLVVVESLAHGVTVCTTDQGCLSEFADMQSVTVIPEGREFEAEAIEMVETLINEGGASAIDRDKIRREGLTLLAENNRQLDILINRICAGR